jgi:mevalonate kinase
MPRLVAVDSHRSEGSAWGKVILLGEHAVVYGVPALAVGIDRGAVASAVKIDDGPCRLRVVGMEVDIVENDPDHDLARAFHGLLEAERAHPSNDQPRGLLVTARADLPPGGGLGCSAALGVAIARAVAGEASEERIRDLAMAWERIFHGSPSGVDAAVAARGGCMLFERGRGVESVRLKGALTLCVGSTGHASSTKTMVEAVARLRQRRPEVVAKAFEGIGSLVQNARLAVEAGDRVGLGRLMDLNQMILSGLFVSTEEIERLCALARGAGALGAKLTGAGGGGSVVALVTGSGAAERVLDAWKTEGFWGFGARIAGVDVPVLATTETSSP